MIKTRSLPLFLSALLSLVLQSTVFADLAGAALASDQDDQDQSNSSRDANAPENREGRSQSLSGQNGDMFMEEVVNDPPKPKPKPKPIPIDLSRVGVSVDPHGNIVPLKDSPDDPWAASGVKPFYNHIESTTTAPYVYQNPYWGGVPYGGYPGNGYGYGLPNAFGYGGYPGAGLGSGLFGLGVGLGSLLSGGRFNPYGYGGYPGVAYPGAGYPGFAYPGYGNFGNPNSPGYSPYGIGYATTGNSATFLSNDPATGSPLPQGSNWQGNFTNNYGTITPGIITPFAPGIVAPGSWLAPSTSYSQNSMWKAFNLGF